MEAPTKPQISFELEDLASLIRLLTLVARESSTFPPPLLSQRLQDGDYFYLTYLPFPIGVSKNTLLSSFFAVSDQKPKDYIRYRSTPSEKLIFQNDKENPVGEYVPIFPLSSSFSPELPSPSHIGNLEVLNLLEVNLQTLRELIRFSLEAAPYPVVFRETSGETFFYFLYDKPLKIGTQKFCRLMYWEGSNEIEQPFISLDSESELHATQGKKTQTFSYARLILLKGSTLHDLVESRTGTRK